MHFSSRYDHTQAIPYNQSSCWCSNICPTKRLPLDHTLTFLAVLSGTNQRATSSTTSGARQSFKGEGHDNKTDWTGERGQSTRRRRSCTCASTQENSQICWGISYQLMQALETDSKELTWNTNGDKLLSNLWDMYGVDQAKIWMIFGVCNDIIYCALMCLIGWRALWCENISMGRGNGQREWWELHHFQATMHTHQWRYPNIGLTWPLI